MDLNGRHVFLSGPMTGLEHHNAEAFAEAHALCKEAGARDVFDPTHEWMYDRSGDESHGAWMLRCVHRLTNWTHQSDGTITSLFDVVVMLDGWEGSPGARTEREVALACGIPVVGVRELREGQ